MGYAVCCPFEIGVLKVAQEGAHQKELKRSETNRLSFGRSCSSFPLQWIPLINEHISAVCIYIYMDAVIFLSCLSPF